MRTAIRHREGGSRLVAAIDGAERAERSRLADALHDDVLQLVLAARQDVAELDDAVGEPSGSALAAVLDEVVDALRSLTQAMHEDSLDELGLDEALARIARDAARRGRFAVAIDVDPAATGVHDGVVRGLARELLANAAKHARAHHVEVTLREEDDVLVLRVADDGRGFAATAAPSGTPGEGAHLGLERLGRTVEELGGDLDVASRPGATAVEVRLPRAALASQSSFERQLGEERRWSSALIAAVRDGLLVVRGGVVVQVNDAFCALVGWPREAIVGRGAHDVPFFPGARRAAYLERAAEAARHRGWEGTTELLRADGSHVEVQCISQRIDDPLGDELGLLWLVRDMTEHRQAEERRRLAAELNSTIETTRWLSRLLIAAGEGQEAVLATLGALLSEHLGWRDVVINVLEGEDGYRARWGTPGAAQALLGGRRTDSDLAPWLVPRFEHDGAFFVPEELDPTGEVPVRARGRAIDQVARPGDILLVPVRHPDGRRFGVVSVDRNRTGRRPTPTELEVLVAVADHAAIALSYVP